MGRKSKAQEYRERSEHARWLHIQGRTGTAFDQLVKPDETGLSILDRMVIDAGHEDLVMAYKRKDGK